MIYPAHQEALIEGRAYRILRAHISEALTDYNLSIPEWTLLGLLHDYKELRFSELAVFLGVEAPLVSNLVKQLDEKSLIETNAHPTDNRAKNLTLSLRATLLMPEIDAAIHQSLTDLMKGVSAADIAAHFRLLAKIIENEI